MWPFKGAQLFVATLILVTMSRNGRGEGRENEDSESSDVEDEVEQTRSTVRSRRPPLFHIPPLGRIETSIHWIATFGIVAYSFHLLRRASVELDYPNRESMATLQPAWLPFVSDARVDISNYEWYHWRGLAEKLIPTLIVHSLVFNLTAFLYGRTHPRLWKATIFLNGAVCNSVLFTVPTVLVGLGYGLVLLAAVRFWPCRKMIWAVACSLLVFNVKNPPIFHKKKPYGQYDEFAAIFFSSYKLLSYISYVNDMLADQRATSEAAEMEVKDGGGKKLKRKRNAKKGKGTEGSDSDSEAEMKQLKSPQDKKRFSGVLSLLDPDRYREFIEHAAEMLSYAMYLPYGCSLIMLYRMYRQRLADRLRFDTRRDWGNQFWFAVRIGTAYLIMELIYRLMWVDLFRHEKIWAETIDRPTLCSLVFWTGVTFSTKYVVMFGLPSLFARIDQMDPLPPPCCIQRTIFFKEYIYIPMVYPTFSFRRKLVGGALAYLFVLIWHGLEDVYFKWISLTFLSLTIENVARSVYSIPSVRTWREAHISDRWFRRLIAFLQIIPAAFLTHGMVFFQLTATVAPIVFRRIFLEDTIYIFRPLFLSLWAVEYVFTQCAMDSENYMAVKYDTYEREQRALRRKRKTD